MKEILRDPEPTRIGYLQSVLESHGISTFIRNENSSNTLAALPIPAFYPALCVVVDAEEGRAREILALRLNSDRSLASRSWVCPSCAEPNPGTFELCYACGHDPLPPPVQAPTPP